MEEKDPEIIQKSAASSSAPLGQRIEEGKWDLCDVFTFFVLVCVNVSV